MYCRKRLGYFLLRSSGINSRSRLSCVMYAAPVPCSKSGCAHAPQARHLMANRILNSRLGLSALSATHSHYTPAQPHPPTGRMMLSSSARHASPRYRLASPTAPRILLPAGVERPSSRSHERSRSYEGRSGPSGDAALPRSTSATSPSLILRSQDVRPDCPASRTLDGSCSPDARQLAPR